VDRSGKGVKDIPSAWAGRIRLDASTGWTVVGGVQNEGAP